MKRIHRIMTALHIILKNNILKNCFKVAKQASVSKSIQCTNNNDNKNNNTNTQNKVQARPTPEWCKQHCLLVVAIAVASQL